MQFDFQRLISRLSFRQLQVFLMVYKLKGYRKAAVALGLTQPAVSSQIKKLEQALDQPLFEYIGRTLYCTEAGEKVAAFIDTLFADIRHLQSDLGTIKGELSGELNITAVNTAQAVLPFLIKGFSQHFTSVKVIVNIVNRAQALVRLEQNNDELMIMTMVPSDRPLAVLPFLDNELIPVTAADISLASITPQQFLDQPLILRERGSGSRLALEQHCADHHLSFDSYMEFGSNDAVKHAVIAGLGVAIMPKFSVMPELTLGTIKTLPLAGFPLRQSWCLVYPRGKHLTPVSQAFYDYIQQNIAEVNRHFGLTVLN